MVKSSNHTTRKSGRTVATITTIGDASGVPLDGVLLEQDGLEVAVDAAVEQMYWLTPTDRATVELARSYARQIDLINMVAAEASERMRNLDPNADPRESAALMEAANKALAASGKALFLGPHLHNALRSIGGDPGSRAEIVGASKAEAEKPVDPLAAMRAKRRA